MTEDQIQLLIRKGEVSITGAARYLRQHRDTVRKRYKERFGKNPSRVYKGRIVLQRHTMQPDRGAPQCPTCHTRYSYDTDGMGFTVESCCCG